MQKNGWGFMQGLVLKNENDLSNIVNLALKNGVLVLKSGKNIIRFLPPIVISKKEIKEGFKRFEEGILDFK